MSASAATAALAVALGLAAPAFASSTGRAAAGGRGGAASPDVHTGVPTKKSTGFAGYDIGMKGGDANPTTTIVVPKLNCTKAPRAIGASVGLFEDSNSNFSSANLFIGCVNGKARYFPFLTVNGNESDLTSVAAHPGDRVLLEANATGSQTFVSVMDQTHPFSKFRTGPGYSAFTGFPWIGDVTWSTSHGVEAPPNFGKIKFTNSTIEGTALGSILGLRRFNRYNRTKTTLQIKTSGFASNNKSFKTIFKHS